MLRLGRRSVALYAAAGRPAGLHACPGPRLVRKKCPLPRRYGLLQASSKAQPGFIHGEQVFGYGFDALAEQRRSLATAPRSQRHRSRAEPPLRGQKHNQFADTTKAARGLAAAAASGAGIAREPEDSLEFAVDYDSARRGFRSNDIESIQGVRDVYDVPCFYDVAFGFREYSAESSFLLDVVQKHIGRAPLSSLELGAGPARHSIELAKKGLRCTCVDANENMVAYGTKIARAANVATKYVQQDMRSLELSPDTQHDFAFCLLGTFQHMLTNQDAVDCLRSAAQYLAEDGIMVIEVSHPQELFSLGDVSAEEWVRELEDGRVLSAQWGSPDDIFDPITQVRESNVAFSVETTGTEDAEMLESMVQVAFQRMFTAQEMDALARASGVFTVVDMYGDMESKVDIGDVDNAFRMVVVLKKRAPAEIASVS